MAKKEEVRYGLDRHEFMPEPPKKKKQFRPWVPFLAVLLALVISFAIMIVTLLLLIDTFTFVDLFKADFWSRLWSELFNK